MGTAGNLAFAFLYVTLADSSGKSWLGGDVAVCFLSVGLSHFALNWDPECHDLAVSPWMTHPTLAWYVVNLESITSDGTCNVRASVHWCTSTWRSMWFGAPGLQTPFGTSKKGVVVDVNGTMEIWGSFFTKMCLCLRIVFAAKIFEAIKKKCPLANNLSRFVSTVPPKTSDFNKALFICLHLLLVHWVLSADPGHCQSRRGLQDDDPENGNGNSSRKLGEERHLRSWLKT